MSEMSYLQTHLSLCASCQSKFDSVNKQMESMEMEVMEARLIRASELNGEMDEDDTGWNHTRTHVLHMCSRGAKLTKKHIQYTKPLLNGDAAWERFRNKLNTTKPDVDFSQLSGCKQAKLSLYPLPYPLLEIQFQAKTHHRYYSWLVLECSFLLRVSVLFTNRQVKPSFSSKTLCYEVNLQCVQSFIC